MTIIISYTMSYNITNCDANSFAWCSCYECAETSREVTWTCTNPSAEDTYTKPVGAIATTGESPSYNAGDYGIIVALFIAVAGLIGAIGYVYSSFGGDDKDEKTDKESETGRDESLIKRMINDFFIGIIIKSEKDGDGKYEYRSLFGYIVQCTPRGNQLPH